MTVELSIVVPAFNEAGRLPDGMRRFEAALSSGAVDADRTEVLLVDDGSTDATSTVAAKLLAPLPHHRVIRLPVNRGKGAAVRAGVAQAVGSCTAYMDADFAIDPVAVPLLLDGLTDHDLAIGCRALPDSMVESTYALRSLMGRLFNELVTTGTGLDLADTQCGFKGLRTPVARLLFHLVRIDRFAFDVELLGHAHRLGLRTTQVPVHWRHVEGSTIHPLHDSVAMLADVYRARLRTRNVPAVPAVVVRSPGTATDRLVEVGAALEAVVGAAPLPALTGAGSTTVLFALLDRGTVRACLRALEERFGAAALQRQDLPPAGLRALGPLSGRLRSTAPPA